MEELYLICYGTDYQTVGMENQQQSKLFKADVDGKTTSVGEYKSHWDILLEINCRE